MPAVDRVNYTVMDGQGKSSKTSFNILKVTAGNLAAAEAAADTLRGLIDPLINGALKSYALDLQTGLTWARPASANIQRGRKWSITLQDQESLRVFVVQLPTALLAAQEAGMIDSSGNIIKTQTDFAALITELETGPWRGPAGGQVKWVQGRLVSRRA